MAAFVFINFSLVFL